MSYQYHENYTYKINSSIMYDFHPHFYTLTQDGAQFKTHYPFKPILPDYIYENFYTLEEENKNKILSFLNMFMNVILNQHYKFVSILEKSTPYKKGDSFQFASKLDIVNFCNEFLFSTPKFLQEYYDFHYCEEDIFRLGEGYSFIADKNKLGVKTQDKHKCTVFSIDIREDNLDNFIHLVSVLLKSSILIFSKKTQLIGKRYCFTVYNGKILNIFLKRKL